MASRKKAETVRGKAVPSPEKFLSRYPAEIRDIADKLRKLVKEALPHAEEKVRPGWELIGYTVKAGRLSKYFGFIAPLENEVQLGFEYGAMLPESELLQGDGKQVRFIQLQKKVDIKPNVLIPLLKEAARLSTMSRDERIRRAEEHRAK